MQISTKSFVFSSFYGRDCSCTSCFLMNRNIAKQKAAERGQSVSLDDIKSKDGWLSPDSITKMICKCSLNFRELIDLWKCLAKRIVPCLFFCLETFESQDIYCDLFLLPNAKMFDFSETSMLGLRAEEEIVNYTANSSPIYPLPPFLLQYDTMRHDGISFQRNN